MLAPTFSRRFATAAVLLAWSALAGAQGFVDPNLRWRTLQTEHFTVHFAEQQRDQARSAAAVAERVLPRITRLLRWEPRERTELIILDSADFSNGFASPLPFNQSGIFLSPPDEGELLQNRDWLELVLTHELFHVVHLDKASGFPLWLRNVFGRSLFPLLPFPTTPFPNLMQPRWIIEGLAVYAETDVASAYGRLENSHFEGMMRAEVARGRRSLAEINADGRGFPLNRNYLYGAYFFAFMRERYGEKSVIAFIENYSNDIIPFRVHTNPVGPTGKTMDVLWEEFGEWLDARFAARAPSIEAPQEGEELARAWTIFSPTLSPAGERWYIQGDGYTLPRLMRRQRDGKAEAVREIEQDTRLVALGNDALLVSKLEICDNYNLYYDLYRIDSSGGRKRLTDCGRNRFAAPLDDGRIVVLQVTKGIAEVVVLDPAGKPLRTLYRAAAGESISGLAAKGNAVVVTSLRGGFWSVVDVGGAEPVVLVSDNALKHFPRFGTTADEVFFIADYGKVYNVWSVRRGSRALARWTRARNGVREISAPVDGELLLTTIEADGDVLRLHRLPAEPLERRYAPSLAGLPEARAEDPVGEGDKPYSPWSSLRPRAWVPIVEAADGMFAVGAAIYGQDALGLHQYFLAPEYEFTQHQVLGTADYIYDERHRVMVNRLMTIKASHDNEVRRYRIKEDVQWVSTWQRLTLNRRFYWGFGAALDQEKEHEVDDGTTSLRRGRVAGLVAGVDTRRRQWLSEGPSQGNWLRLFAETSDKLKADYAGNVVRADWRAHLPIRQSALALRWNEAYGTKDAQPFELGGSRSDDYIPLPVLNQREFALRGYTSGEPELTGHRARIWSAEFRTPLIDIDRHAMTPPIGINRLSLNVFLDVGAAWERGARPDYHKGVGIEVMTEPRFAYLFGLAVRAGIARGLDNRGETQLYLRGGRSF